MGGFLGALGGIGQGFGQGTQVIPDLMAKVQQIQQAQMLLDAQKRQLAAHPAIAAFLAQGGMGGGQPQGSLPSQGGSQGGPMMPMTGPPPAMPQGPAMAPGQNSVAPPPMGAPPPNGGPPPQGIMPPAQGGGMPGAPPPPRPPMAGPPQGAPAPIAPPMAAKPPPTSGKEAIDNMGTQAAGMMEGQAKPGTPGTPSDPQQILLKIAAGIKKANPNISPEVLLDATSEFIDMMKGITPDYRAQLQSAYQNAALAERTNRDLMAHQDRMAALNDRIKIVGMQQAGATQRAAMVQASIDRRAASSTGYRQQALVDKQRVAKATAAASAAWHKVTQAQQAAALADPGDTAAADRVQKALDDYNNAVQNQQSVYDDVLSGGSSGGGATPAPSGGGKPAGKGQPVPPDRAKDPDGTTYNGGKFVKRGNQIFPAGQ